MRKNYLIGLIALVVIIAGWGVWNSHNSNTNQNSTDTSAEIDGHEFNDKRLRKGEYTSPLRLEDMSKTRPSEPVIDKTKFGHDVESTFAHITLVSRLGSDGFIGYEVGSDSQEYRLEDFGFVEGDIITHINNVPAPESSEGLIKKLSALADEETVFLTLNRNNVILELEVDLN